MSISSGKSAQSNRDRNEKQKKLVFIIGMWNQFVIIRNCFYNESLRFFDAIHISVTSDSSHALECAETRKVQDILHPAFPALIGLDLFKRLSAASLGNPHVKLLHIRIFLELL